MFTEEIDCAHCEFQKPFYQTKGTDGPEKM